LHTQTSYTLAELVKFQLLTFQRGSVPFIRLRELLAKHSLEATQVHAISSVSAMLQLVAGGLGIAALPAAAVDDLAREQGFIELCCHAQLPEVPLYMSWRTDPADEALDSIAKSLSTFISEHVTVLRPKVAQ
jgi:DNA-binding transcriptional LysR family regulator